jgi:hypothetical protein
MDYILVRGAVASFFAFLLYCVSVYLSESIKILFIYFLWTYSQHVEAIMKNVYYLLATYRPHQARQAIVKLMQQQIERRRKVLTELDAYVIECVLPSFLSHRLETSLRSICKSRPRRAT